MQRQIHFSEQRVSLLQSKKQQFSSQAESSLKKNDLELKALQTSLNQIKLAYQQEQANHTQVSKQHSHLQSVNGANDKMNFFKVIADLEQDLIKAEKQRTAAQLELTAAKIDFFSNSATLKDKTVGSTPFANSNNKTAQFFASLQSLN